MNLRRAPTPSFTLRALAPVLLASALVACSPTREAAPAATTATVAAPTTVPALIAAGEVPTTVALQTYEPVRSIAPDGVDPAALARAVVRGGVPVKTEDGVAMLRPNGVGGKERMDFVAAKELADGRIAAIFNGSEADADGSSSLALDNEGTVHVYLLRRSDDAKGGGWLVEARHEGVAALGTRGDAGNVRWAALGPGKEGFIVSPIIPSMGESEMTGESVLFELGSEIREVGRIQNRLDESGACYPDGETCRDVSATLRFVDDPGAGAHGYRDILVDYTGRRFTVVEEKDGSMKERPLDTIKQSARFRFDGKAYVLQSGSNPMAGGRK